MPEPTLQATIPGVPPSVNHTLGRGGHRVYKHADVRRWASDVEVLVRESCALRPDVHRVLQSRPRRPEALGQTIRITMTWYRPDRRKRDSANIIKVLEDGIARGLGVDDRWFEWTTRRAYDTQNPRVELSISPEGGPA